MRLIIVSLTTLDLLTNCSDKEFDDSEIFIGSYRIMDQMIPYPYKLQHKNNSVFLFDNTGSLVDKIESKGMNWILTIELFQMEVIKRKTNTKPC